MSSAGKAVVERWMVPRTGIPESIRLIQGGEYYFFWGTAQVAAPVFETEEAALKFSVERADKARLDAEKHYQELYLRLVQLERDEAGE